MRAPDVAVVLALHAPVRRYQAASRGDALTYPTAERALQVNRRHPMRGFEALVMSTPDDVPYIEVCGECSRIENAGAETVNGYGDDRDDHQDGTELSMTASAWPCATFTALSVDTASPVTALATVRAVVDRWEYGALVNRGAHWGTVFVEPLETLPPGLEEIRTALDSVH